MMPEFEDYEVGDEVIVHDVEDPAERDEIEVFVAGWDCEMDKHIGDSGIVQRIGDDRYGRPTYLIEFEDGEQWWWDPVYMQRFEEDESAKPVSDEDFEEILN